MANPIKSNIYDLQKSVNRLSVLIKKIENDNLQPFVRYKKMAIEIAQLVKYINEFNLFLDIDMEIHSCLKRY